MCHPKQNKYIDFHTLHHTGGAMCGFDRFIDEDLLSLASRLTPKSILNHVGICKHIELSKAPEAPFSNDLHLISLIE